MVSADGKGFPEEAISYGLGLNSIRKRVLALGGMMQMRNEVGAVVEISIPV